MLRQISLIAVFILFASCEKTIQVTLPEYTPKLVITSDATSDGNINVKVSRSIEIRQYNGTQNFLVDDATVKLYIDDKFEEIMQWQIDTSTPGTIDFGHFIASKPAVPGKNYKITVSAPGLPEAEAESGVAQFVAVEVQRTSETRIGRWGPIQQEVSIKFNDPPTKGDYYFIEIITARERDTSMPDSGYYYFSESMGCISTTDRSLAAISSDFLFDDASCINERDLFLKDDLFNGGEKEFKFFVDSMSISSFENRHGETIYPLVKFYHIPEAYFKFLKSYNYATDNYQNPFAEPTNVYTNVKNGYGVFSLSSVDSKELK